MGEGLRASGLARDEVFIETKLWISDYTYDGAMHGFERSLGKLGLDHVDLYLLHQPAPAEFERTLGAWKVLGEIAASGRAHRRCFEFQRSADRSRYRRDRRGPRGQSGRAAPLLHQFRLAAFHAEKGIATQAWSPIGGVNRYFTDDPRARSAIR